MSIADFRAQLGPELADVLEKRGFASLTLVQEAVLDPALATRDLRITSQTGSGKTIAIGLSVRDLLVSPAAPSNVGVARPRVLVVAPTRELAKQVDEELSWVSAALGAKIASVTGGGSYRDERRALGASPVVVVGTPGRLLDHLQRGSVDPSCIAAVVLDEADRMLDLGFRDELEAILGHAPEGHRTHLVSATFPREVRALADSVQSDPAHVEGTKLGTANVDIEHVIHLVQPRERVAAIINLLLSSPGAQTLIFARTRADVADLTSELEEAGFGVCSLSGEMEQPARNRALAAFKRGDKHALVATDVAARGIDVVDIARVIHAEPPTDADAYTHRSGRTGRAGRKGTSSILVTPMGLRRTIALLERARVRHRVEPIPSAEMIRESRDAQILSELTETAAADGDATSGTTAAPIDPRWMRIAERIAEGGHTTVALARLIEKVEQGASREGKGQRQPRDLSPVGVPSARRSRPGLGWSAGPDARPDDGAAGGGPRPRKGDWVSFRVSWGQAHGADPRRLLAMVCRRGGIRGTDVGSIRVAETYSVVDVSVAASAAFASAASEPDPRDARVVIRPFRDAAATSPRVRQAPSEAQQPPAPPAPPQREPAPPPPEEAPPPRTRPLTTNVAPRREPPAPGDTHGKPPSARRSERSRSPAPPARTERPVQLAEPVAQRRAFGGPAHEGFFGRGQAPRREGRVVDAPPRREHPKKERAVEPPPRREHPQPEGRDFDAPQRREHPKRDGRVVDVPPREAPKVARGAVPPARRSAPARAPVPAGKPRFDPSKKRRKPR